jgi:hypothetical protein
MYLSCGKAFSVLHNRNRRDVTDKVHNSMYHLNSNYVNNLKDSVDISGYFIHFIWKSFTSRDYRLVQAICGGYKIVLSTLPRFEILCLNYKNPKLISASMNIISESNL